MDYYKINQPGGPQVLTGDWFLEDRPDLVVRTGATPSSPFFVAEDLGALRDGLMRHSVWVVTTDGKFGFVCEAPRPGMIYQIAKLLNDDYWEAKKASLYEGLSEEMKELK
tara:strand:+ start:245 stop:574 length:330 start_codon:yes stop_codon:yes gene_type:complete